MLACGKPLQLVPIGATDQELWWGTRGEDGAIVSGSDGRSAGDYGDYGGQAGPGGIPPSFGASSSPPAAPGPASAAPAPSPALPGSAPAVPEPSPAAGPFAKPAGAAGWTRAWRGRSTLMNALLFGVAAVTLAAVIVAAFLIVSPGKGSASSLGFKAGPAPSTQQLTASAMATPSQSPSASPSAHKKKHPRAPSSASPGAKTAARSGKSATATPKPAHEVTPHNLGRPNFAGYCQHIGHRTAELVASNAYGWRCTLNPSIVLKAVSVCAWTYHLSTGRVIDVSTNYSDPSAWQCWRINRELGAIDFTRYCIAAGHGTSKLVANNAYGWQCTSPAAAVDTTAACNLLYHVTDAVSRFAVFSSPYYWQCWN